MTLFPKTESDRTPIISVKETRKVLGIKASNLPDDDVLSIIQQSVNIARILLNRIGHTI